MKSKYTHLTPNFNSVTEFNLTSALKTKSFSSSSLVPLWLFLA